jgi:hypothetical protein
MTIETSQLTNIFPAVFTVVTRLISIRVLVYLIYLGNLARLEDSEDSEHSLKQVGKNTMAIMGCFPREGAVCVVTKRIS